MKKQIIVAIILSCLLTHSCSKRSDSYVPGVQKSNGTLGGGEDDDFPIIIKIRRPIGSGIDGCVVVMYNQVNDTVQGVTDNAGNCMLNLTCLGTWGLSVTHDGYLPLTDNIYIPMAQFTIIDTLQEE